MSKPVETKAEEFSDRLVLARANKGMSLSQLSKETGISYEMLRRYSEGIATPRHDKLEVLAEKLGVTPAWLQFGDTLMPLPGAIAVQEETDTEYTHKEVQVFDYKLSAGFGNFSWIANHKEDPLVFREQWFRAKRLRAEDLRGMYVKGDSMSPELNNMDTVIIDITDIDPADGEIYACLYNEKLFIKRIRHNDKGLLLVSSNTEYPTIEVPSDVSSDKFKILGRMVWRGG